VLCRRWSAQDAQGAETGAARVLQNRERCWGLGLWIAEEKPRLAFVGWFALKYITKTAEIEFG